MAPIPPSQGEPSQARGAESDLIDPPLHHCWEPVRNSAHDAFRILPKPFSTFPTLCKFRPTHKAWVQYLSFQGASLTLQPSSSCWKHRASTLE